MPTYEYRCEKCGDFEVLQKITEDALKTCPTCGGSTQRLISATAFHLKGSGWYKTDYSGPSASGSDSGDKADKTDSAQSNDGANPAPAAAAEPAAATPAPVTPPSGSTD